MNKIVPKNNFIKLALSPIINEIVINASIPIMLRKFFLKVKIIRDKEIKQNP